jgi:hypothetical protein
MSIVTCLVTLCSGCNLERTNPSVSPNLRLIIDVTHPLVREVINTSTREMHNSDIGCLNFGNP